MERRNGVKLLIGLVVAMMAMVMFMATALAAFDVNVTTVQNIEYAENSPVTVVNNKDGTLTVTMPELSSTTATLNTSDSTTALCNIGYAYKVHGNYMTYPYCGKAIYNGYFTGLTGVLSRSFVVNIADDYKAWTELFIYYTTGALTEGTISPSVLGIYDYANPSKTTYHLNGGTVSGSADDKVEYIFLNDKLATTFGTPKKEGMVFDGWYTEAEGGEKTTTKIKVQYDTVHDYYAHWVEKTPEDEGSVDTGDNTPVMLLFAMALLGAAGLMVMLRRKNRA